MKTKTKRKRLLMSSVFTMDLPLVKGCEQCIIDARLVRQSILQEKHFNLTCYYSVVHKAYHVHLTFKKSK